MSCDPCNTNLGDLNPQKKGLGTHKKVEFYPLYYNSSLKDGNVDGEL